MQFDDKDMDKDLSSEDEDKDKDLKIGPPGSIEDKDFPGGLDNNTGLQPFADIADYRIARICRRLCASDTKNNTHSAV